MADGRQNEDRSGGVRYVYVGARTGVLTTQMAVFQQFKDEKVRQYIRVRRTFEARLDAVDRLL